MITYKDALELVPPSLRFMALICLSLSVEGGGLEAERSSWLYVMVLLQNI